MHAVRKTVLMIEDNPADAEIIREEISMTQNVDFTLETAGTLADGLAYIRDHKVAGVLLDLSLPDSHGMETFKRTREKAPELPIVVLTGNDDEELGLQAVREGAQDYIVKGHLNGAGLARSVEYAIERKRVDAKLRRAKNMEAITHLSMGMVNDINNVLAIILVKLQSLEWPLRDDDLLQKEISDARQAVFRGANLTKRLSAFCGAGSLEKEVIDLNQQITNVAGMLSAVAGTGSEVVTNLANYVRRVEIDPLALETALINLVTNAKEAMAGGGSVTISTENVVIEPGDFVEDDASPGPYVLLSVSDIGTGMSVEQQKNASEPFFTTKSDAEGHGLGLSMVFGFVRQSRGFMRIVSEEGSGTSVQLFLPIANKAEEKSGHESVEPLAAMANGETVLVVDSDPSVGDAIAGQLEEFGYTVLQAATPAHVFEVLESHGDIAVVLMDVQLSDKIDSVSLATEVIETRPAAKILYTSAHDRKAFKQIGIPDDLEDVLFKPYPRSDLASKLRELLEINR